MTETSKDMHTFQEDSLVPVQNTEYINISGESEDEKTIRLINSLLRMLHPGEELKEVGFESLNDVLRETIYFLELKDPIRKSLMHTSAFRQKDTTFSNISFDDLDQSASFQRNSSEKKKHHHGVHSFMTDVNK